MQLRSVQLDGRPPLHQCHHCHLTMSVVKSAAQSPGNLAAVVLASPIATPACSRQRGTGRWLRSGIYLA